MISSLCVLTQRGDTLLVKHFASDLTHAIDAFVKVKDHAGLVTQVGDYICVRCEVNDLYLVALAQEELSVPVVTETLYFLINLLKSALGQVDSDSIRDNFSKVLLAIEELFEHGMPFTQNEHVFRYFFNKPSFFARLTSNPEKHLEDSLSNEHMNEAPWRPRGLRYTLNEILIDVIESVDCILDKQWNMLAYQIMGFVQVNASLSGMPDLTAYLHMPHPFLHYSFHPTLFPRRKRFIDEGALAFVPLDKKYIAFKYAIHDLKPSLPFQVTPSLTFEEEAMQMELTAVSRMIMQDRHAVDEFKIVMVFPK